MVVSDELHVLSLPDGETIAAHLSYESGIIVRRRDRSGVEVGTVGRAYPLGGFGGGGWLLSPSGRLLVLGYYSGQSEEAFLLLDLAGEALRMVAAAEYRPRSLWLLCLFRRKRRRVLALPRSSTWWEAWEDDWPEDAEDGTPSFLLRRSSSAASAPGK